jgi:hypothetical protein
MSQEKLQAYMKQEYEGVVITTNPYVDETGDPGVISSYPNSLAGRFQLGETVTGTTSGATGIVVKKNLDINQLVLQNVVGSFIGNSAPGPSNATESITGSLSDDSVNTYDVYKYIDAPHNYYRTDDPDKRLQTNGIFITGGEPSGELSFHTHRNHLFTSNEARSSMRVIDPKYITDFVEKYEAIINNV